MGSQSEAFLNGLGDEWLERNRADLGREPDLPMTFLKDMKPGKVIEYGCANGWRLKKLQDLGWDVYGVEPSWVAVKEARKLLGGGTNGRVWRGIAGNGQNLEWDFDVTILGGCMSLSDPEDWPGIVAEVDEDLNMGGHLLVNDFDLFDAEAMSTDTVTPKEPYHPFTLRSIYWPRLWEAYPTYYVVAAHREKGTRNVCYMLKKDRYFDHA